MKKNWRCRICKAGGKDKDYWTITGIANHLLKRSNIVKNGEVFGKVFEHYIYQEIWAYSKYSGKDFNISYWRTATQLEVDFILGDNQVAIEVKGTEMALPYHCKGLYAFSEEYKTKKLLLVSLDLRPRNINNITVLPWKDFIYKLWAGEII